MKLYAIIIIIIFFIFGVVVNMKEDREEYSNMFRLFWDSIPIGFLFGF